MGALAESHEPMTLYCSLPVKANLVTSKGRYNLITDDVYLFESYEQLEYEIDNFRVNIKDLLQQSNQKTFVYHLFYEFGEYIEDLIDEHSFELNLKAESEIKLWIELEYTQSELLSNYSFTPQTYKWIACPCQKDKKDEYSKNFKAVRDHLLRGDCYQVNLTDAFESVCEDGLIEEKTIHQLFSQPSNLGAYAHASIFPKQKFSLISNSPECLFQSRLSKRDSRLDVWSMPIKGTMSFERGRDCFFTMWEKLKNSQKNQAELYMITDLLRNDLGRIKLTPVHIIAKKKPLIAPGLIHQYSLLLTSLNLSEDSVYLYDLIKGLFPGGSITGAPKKRVMKIIKALETRPRGFYCGSTILAYQGNVCASINIRSGELDWVSGKLTVGAGGGITLDSEEDDEYEEMLKKLSSILQALN